MKPVSFAVNSFKNGPLSVEQLAEFAKFHGQPVTHLHGRSFGTIQENSKRSPTSSGRGSGGLTFANYHSTQQVAAVPSTQQATSAARAQ